MAVIQIGLCNYAFLNSRRLKLCVDFQINRNNLSTMLKAICLGSAVWKFCRSLYCDKQAAVQGLGVWFQMKYLDSTLTEQGDFGLIRNLHIYCIYMVK